MVMRLLRALLDLLRAWWSVDRIRVSPNEGRLLRLDAGALLTIEDRAVEVLGRRIRRQPAGAVIAYDCRTPSGAARLLIRQPRDGGDLSAQWSEGGTVRLLHEADVIIWRASRA